MITNVRFVCWHKFTFLARRGVVSVVADNAIILMVLDGNGSTSHLEALFDGGNGVSIDC